MTFSTWLDEVRTEAPRMGFSDISIASFDTEAWHESYESGLSPVEALIEDIMAGI